jgi:MoaA/NifB/PqqE/SkfB family radical SAM enzyme
MSLANISMFLRNRYSYSGWNNRGGTLNKQGVKNPCYYPSYMMMIDSNGDVLPCCQEWHRRLKVGNACYDNLFEIWKSINIRVGLGRGHRCLFPCRICGVDGTLRGRDNFERFNELSK